MSVVWLIYFSVYAILCELDLHSVFNVYTPSWWVYLTLKGIQEWMEFGAIRLMINTWQNEKCMGNSLIFVGEN